MSQTMTPPTPPPPLAAHPRRRRRGWLVLGVAAVALVALVGGALVAVTWLARDVESRGMSIAAVPSVQFRGDAATFKLVETERDDVRVDIEMTSSTWGDPAVETEVVDGVLRITSDCPDLLAFVCSTTTVVEVPRGTLETLAVEVDAGRIVLRGSAAEVVATTQAGRIELVEHQGTVATLRTHAGRVEVDARVAPTDLTVQASTGDVDVLLPAATYDLDATTNVGTVSTSVREASDAVHHVTARTTVGDVDVHMR